MVKYASEHFQQL